ncbi:MAG TPA: hypothetical protein VGP08_21525 [Pyrinomonadaceae bacterium]|jgi:hypothetical protein|nr:hypothetical protein [Pyrinomonadaceae bacterium]
MNRLRPVYGELEFVLRVICVVAAGAARSLLAPVSWRGYFARTSR